MLWGKDFDPRLKPGTYYSFFTHLALKYNIKDEPYESVRESILKLEKGIHNTQFYGYTWLTS